MGALADLAGGASRGDTRGSRELSGLRRPPRGPSRDSEADRWACEDGRMAELTSIEICAGAGGQALGVERAGFAHRALVEQDADSVGTLRSVRGWAKLVRHLDVKEWRATRFAGQVDLFAAGVPCPPFSRAGLRRGAGDE